MKRATLILATFALLFGGVGQAKADFVFLSDSAVFNPVTNDVLFTVVFNQAPDFSTVNQFGAQADSFQFFILGDTSLGYPAEFDSIIRGEEIHITGNALRVRNAVPSDPDPNSGGWGSIRGSIPFNVNSNVLTFSAPLQLFSDHSSDGNFAYWLESYQFGAQTMYDHNGHSLIATPEPATLTLLVIGSAVIAGYGWRRRKLAVA
jgi:hypothetical protein